MKRILDAAFRYSPSFATDLRKTFARARRAQREQSRAASPQQDPSRVVDLARRRG